MEVESETDSGMTALDSAETPAGTRASSVEDAGAGTDRRPLLRLILLKFSSPLLQRQTD